MEVCCLAAELRVHGEEHSHERWIAAVAPGTGGSTLNLFYGNRHVVVGSSILCFGPVLYSFVMVSGFTERPVQSVDVWLCRRSSEQGWGFLVSEGVFLVYQVFLTSFVDLCFLSLDILHFGPVSWMCNTIGGHALKLERIEKTQL